VAAFAESPRAYPPVLLSFALDANQDPGRPDLGLLRA